MPRFFNTTGPCNPIDQDSSYEGEDFDIVPSPAEILALATASLVDIPASDLRLLTRKLKEPER